MTGLLRRRLGGGFRRAAAAFGRGVCGLFFLFAVSPAVPLAVPLRNRNIASAAAVLGVLAGRRAAGRLFAHAGGFAAHTGRRVFV